MNAYKHWSQFFKVTALAIILVFPLIEASLAKDGSDKEIAIMAKQMQRIVNEIDKGKINEVLEKIPDFPSKDNPVLAGRFDAELEILKYQNYLPTGSGETFCAQVENAFYVAFHKQIKRHSDWGSHPVNGLGKSGRVAADLAFRRDESGSVIIYFKFLLES